MSKPPPLVATNVPHHVAIIMDGNGRWAQRRGLPREHGHQAGARTVRTIVTRAREVGVKALTLYAFSAQNWRRPMREVAQLMALLVRFCESERRLLLDNGIRFRVIGERSRLPVAARGAVEMLERLTASNRDMDLLIALSYGGREEIVNVCRELARAARDGTLDPEKIDEKAVQARLWTADVPDPDLLIRTSGEMRLSNFLLWQIAYAELHMEPCMWPDFDADAFDAALLCYAGRERRFGDVAAVPSTALG